MLMFGLLEKGAEFLFFISAMDATKIRTELGWKPTVEFDEGIRQLI